MSVHLKYFDAGIIFPDFTLVFGPGLLKGVVYFTVQFTASLELVRNEGTRTGKRYRNKGE